MKKMFIALAAVATLASVGFAASEASARGGRHGGGGFHRGGAHFHGGHIGHRHVFHHRHWGGRRVVVGGIGGFGVVASGCYRRVWTPYGWVVRNVCIY